MTTSRSPLRIEAELLASAAAAAKTMSRSAAQQIAHWARIGRELEQSADVSMKDIAEVLRGAKSYDELSPREQAVVRARWEERMAELIDGLRIDEELTAAGLPYAELDGRGRVVVRGAKQRKTKPKAARR